MKNCLSLFVSLMLIATVLLQVNFSALAVDTNIDFDTEISTDTDTETEIDTYFYTDTQTDSEESTDIEYYIKGDINEDGKLDIVDVMMLRGYIIGNLELNDIKLKIADMNSDNSQDIIDVVFMRKVIVDGGIPVDTETDIDTDTIIETDTDIITETDSETDVETESDTEIDTDTDIITQVITKTYQVWVIDDNTKLRVRYSPSLSATQMGWLYGGETLKIYETTVADGYTWGKIYKVDEDKKYDGYWCALNYATNSGAVTEQETITIVPPSPDVDPNEVIDTLPALYGEDKTVSYIKIKDNYTSVYNANHKSEFYAPVYSQLPEGTLEYLSKNDGKYHISTDGRKYLISNDKTEIVSGNGIGENNLQVRKIEENDGATILTIKMDDKTAFNIQPYLVTYTRLDSTDHFYTVNEFKPTEIRVTFDNVTGITSLPMFNGSDLFSAIRWEKVTDSGKTKFCLVLTLKQVGIYNGSNATYDASGNLVIKFSRYPKTLSGSVIVLDSGHGLNNSGAIGYLNGQAIYESTVCLSIAKKLETELLNLGATVYVLPTDTQVIDHKERAHIAREHNADVFISIHANSVEAGYSSARGTQAYYYNSASYPLARSVVDKVEAVLGYSNLADTCLESEYSVTTQNDFASILLETGFMSNSADLAIISNPTKQTEIAKAIAEGISEFFTRKN